MTPVAALRWSGAFWLIPVLFALGVFVATSYPSSELGYGAAQYASASRCVILVGPALAVAGAYLGAPLSRFFSTRPSARPRVIAYVVAMWPVLFLGPAAGILAMMWAVRDLPADARTWVIGWVVFVTLIACGTTGILVGRVLGPVVSIPIVALGWFSWLALPGGGSSVLLRNLNSSFVGCCTADQRPAGAMLIGSLMLTMILIIGTAVSLTRWTSRPHLVGGLILTFTTALAGGGAMANLVGKPLNLLAVEQRTSETTCQESQQIEVCVWPEHEPYLRLLLPVLADGRAKLEAAGLDVPARFNEQSEPRAAEITVSAGSTEVSTRLSMAQGLLPPADQCFRSGVGSEYDRAVAWLALTIGATPDDLSFSVSEQALVEAQAVTLQSDDEQLRWFNARTAALTSSCSGG